MKQTLSLFSAFALSLSQTAALCNLYLFFGTTQSTQPSTIAFWPWLGCSALSLLMLHLFLRKERTVTQIASLGCGCTAVTCLVMLVFFTEANGVFAWVCAVAFLLITSVTVCVTPLGAFHPQSLLLCCELPAIGIGLLLIFAQSGVLAYPADYAAGTLALFLFSLLALATAKYDTATTPQERGKQAAALATTLTCFAGLGAVCAAYVAFASAGAAQTVARGAAVVSAACTMLLQGLNAFLTWLFALFPAYEGSLPDSEMGSVSISASGGGGSTGSGAAAAVALGILCLLALAGAVWLFWQNRGKRLQAHSKPVQYQRPTTTQIKPSFWQRLWAAMLQKWDALCLAMRLMHLRNTPSGAAILLAQIGAKRGCAKKDSESYAAYLARLATLYGASDPAAAQNFARLSAMLSRALYAPPHSAQHGNAAPPQGKCPHPENLSAKEHRHLRRCIARGKPN